MDVRSLTAPQGYTAARPATHPEPRTESAEDGLMSVASDFAATLQQGENAAMAAMTGDADPHEIGRASCRERV